MFRSVNSTWTLSALVFCLLVLSSWAGANGSYGIGKSATAEEIAGWDIDIRPDGKGLPPGSGSVEEGEWLYEDKCASCHGSFGEGVGRYPVLSGGEGTLAEDRPEKTVGSYWPYASTLWDYIHRAMPFTAPQSMTDEEVYAITAYVLYLNDLVEDDFVLTADNLASVEMPNQEGFFLDDRPDTNNTRCLENCKETGSVRIISEPQMVTLKAEDEQAANEPEVSPGQAIYEQACQMCHAAGVAGAPITGDEGAWAGRVSTGRDMLVTHAVQGIGAMPAKGGQLQLSDEEVASAVDYMIQLSQ